MFDFPLTAAESFPGKDGHPYYVLGKIPINDDLFLKVCIRMWFGKTDKSPHAPTSIDYRLRVGEPVNAAGVRVPVEDSVFESLGWASASWTSEPRAGDQHRSMYGQLVASKYPAPHEDFVLYMVETGMLDAVLDGIHSLFPTIQWSDEETGVDLLAQLVKGAVSHVPEIPSVKMRAEVTIGSAPLYHFLDGKVLVDKTDIEPPPPKVMKPAPDWGKDKPALKTKAASKSKSKTKAPELAPGVTANDIGL